MKKIAAIAALALVAALLLAGCAPAEPSESEAAPVAVGSEQGTLRFYSVELPEKHAVDCVASQYSANVIKLHSEGR